MPEGRRGKFFGRKKKGERLRDKGRKKLFSPSRMRGHTLVHK